jgi:DNA-binding transcriptional MerR regulator
MGYTVKTVSGLAGVSIRTLHHYDEIGLLTPAGATESGYRLYSDRDLERLQQILFFRELEMGLKEIGEILDDPGFDRRQALVNQRQALMVRRERIKRLIRTIDQTLESLEGGKGMKEKEMFEGFDAARYEAEAKEKWGDTPQWKESQRKTRRYTKVDWAAIRGENARIIQGIADAMGRGERDAAVQDGVRQFHEHINRRYYTCTAEIFRGLADGYVDDPRFAATWEKIKPGLAAFLRKAMLVYCDTLPREAEG